MGRFGGEGSQMDENANRRLIQGLAIGALISVPVWVWIGIVVVLLSHEGPVSVFESAVLIIAAFVALMILRYVWHTVGPRNVLRTPPSASSSAISAVRPTLLRQTLWQLGLVGAYLHYYFWEIQLQISSLNSVTVFVGVAALGSGRA